MYISKHSKTHNWEIFNLNKNFLHRKNIAIIYNTFLHWHFCLKACLRSDMCQYLTLKYVNSSIKLFIFFKYLLLSICLCHILYLYHVSVLCLVWKFEYELHRQNLCLLRKVEKCWRRRSNSVGATLHHQSIVEKHERVYIDAIVCKIVHVLGDTVHMQT
jgi:hypothetical protein